MFSFNDIIMQKKVAALKKRGSVMEPRV